MPNVEVEKAFKESLGDIEKIDDGKYLYRFFTGKFDIDKFNREFDQYKENRIQDRDERQKNVLDELNKPNEEPPVYNLSIGTILINTKDSLLNILDDMLKLNISVDTFTKENRLFYLGITIVFVSILLYLFSLFVVDAEKKETGKPSKTTEIIHTHNITYFGQQEKPEPPVKKSKFIDLKWFDSSPEEQPAGVIESRLPKTQRKVPGNAPLVETQVSPTPEPTPTETEPFKPLESIKNKPLNTPDSDLLAVEENSTEILKALNKRR